MPFSSIMVMYYIIYLYIYYSYIHIFFNLYTLWGDSQHYCKYCITTHIYCFDDTGFEIIKTSFLLTNRNIHQLRVNFFWLKFTSALPKAFMVFFGGLRQSIAFLWVVSGVRDLRNKIIADFDKNKASIYFKQIKLF